MGKEIKYRVIHRFKEKYPINQMCIFFEVSRSGYYNWVKRIDRADKDEPVMAWIKQCQEKTKQTYGYRRVQIWLQKVAGIYINHKAVLRIMNKYDLLAAVRRRRRHIPFGQSLHRYKNLLDRNFSATSPNKKWVTDITYIHTKQGILYLSVIKDLYDGFIVGYNTSTVLSNSLVLKTVKDAIKKEKIAGELALHSDQGFQYTSQAYFNLTKEYCIKPSMSRKGNPLDNAPIESFFATLKTECIRRAKPAIYEDARLLIDQYIHYYNYERIQLKTKLTPFEKRCQIA